MLDLLKYRKNIHSAEGEDGIIQKIFEILKIENGWCVEFGAWDGIHLSNTFSLIEKGWKAVLIESDQTRYQQCCQNMQKYNKNVEIINCLVSSEDEEKKLDNILSRTSVPTDFDLLSIDVDSCDYQIWQSIEKYKPKIVIIEINSSFEEGVEVIYNPQDNQGSSFTSTLKLGNLKGYRLLCSTGNMFFIRTDISFPETNAYHLGMNYKFE